MGGGCEVAGQLGAEAAAVCGGIFLHAGLVAAAGADDLFYEPVRHRAYLITGSGAVDVYEVAPDKSLKAVDSIKTGPGAKTGLLVLSLKSLFVAVPATSAQPAEIRMYSTTP